MGGWINDRCCRKNLVVVCATQNVRKEGEVLLILSLKNIVTVCKIALLRGIFFVPALGYICMYGHKHVARAWISTG